MQYYIVYCCWLAVELIVVYFFYVETRYTPLEEICKHFDGEDAVLGGAVATEKGKVLAGRHYPSFWLSNNVLTYSAAEIGGLDTVDLGEKHAAVEHKEL